MCIHTVYLHRCCTLYCILEGIERDTDIRISNRPDPAGSMCMDMEVCIRWKIGGLKIEVSLLLRLCFILVCYECVCIVYVVMRKGEWD